MGMEQWAKSMEQRAMGKEQWAKSNEQRAMSLVLLTGSIRNPES